MTQLPPATASPAYGASVHYDEKYFAWQNRSIDLKAQRKIRTFQPYVRPDHRAGLRLGRRRTDRRAPGQVLMVATVKD